MDVSVLRDSEGEGNQVSTSENEVSVERIFRVIRNVVWASLWARPEWLTIFVLGIVGEDVDQVLDLVVEQTFEVESGDIDALAEVS